MFFRDDYPKENLRVWLQKAVTEFHYTTLSLQVLGFKIFEFFRKYFFYRLPHRG